MNKQEKDAWYKCLILWESISSIPDCKKELFIHTFKNVLAIKLGITEKDMYFGCPLCDEFINFRCNKCPLTIFYNTKYSNSCVICTSYGKWTEKYPDIIQDISIAFYKELIFISKKRGYIPNVSFKYWDEINVENFR